MWAESAVYDCHVCALWLAGRLAVSSPAALPPTQRRYACFNTVLDLSCHLATTTSSTSSSSSRNGDAARGATMLVFESARYGQ